MRATADRIRANGGKAITVRADVSDETALKAMFAAALNEFGRIDVVVHSAGIMPMSKIGEGDVATFDKRRSNLR